MILSFLGVIITMLRYFSFSEKEKGPNYPYNYDILLAWNSCKVDLRSCFLKYIIMDTRDLFY